MNFTEQNQARGLMMRRLFILLAGMVIGLVVSGAVAMVIGADTTPRVRVATIIQDVFVFILPAVLVAVLSSRLPASFLRIDKGFNIWALAAAVLLMVVSVPMQNALIRWNQSLQLPELIEQWMRASENRATASINLLMGGTSVADLVMGLIIVGVFAGLGEELFFRGALQRIFRGESGNAHAAIWTAAVIFSAFHFQFYGFVPRLLLGAFFGYLAWWSGSLWLPVTVHTLNNMMVVTTQWTARCQDTVSTADTFGADSWPLIAASVVLTACALAVVRRFCREKAVRISD